MPNLATDDIREIASALCGLDEAGLVQGGATDGGCTVSFGFRAISLVLIPEGWFAADLEVDHLGRRISWASFDTAEARYRETICGLLDLPNDAIVFERLQIVGEDDALVTATFRRHYSTAIGSMVLHSRAEGEGELLWLDAEILPAPLSFRLVIEGRAGRISDVVPTPAPPFS